MNFNDYIDSTEALKELGLYKEGKSKVKSFYYLTCLVDRGLLVRYGTFKSYKYNLEEVRELFQKHLTEGLSLTARPKKEAA